MKVDIKSLTPEEFAGQLEGLGLQKYRAGQVLAWVYRGARSFEEMTNLSKGTRELLDGRYYISAPELLRRQVSASDGTIKYLWGFSDGAAVETVALRHRHGRTICISTQAGCRQGCAFCASAIGGLERNLLPSEMIDEVLFSQLDCGEKLSNVVLMGTGEPLDNFDNVVRFLQLLNHPEALGIGMRHVTLSTCGLTEKFDSLAALDLQLTLSVSLHAPDDETRDELMPVNRTRGGVSELVSKCEEYFRKTGRRVSFEYAMLSGVNDSPEQAGKLAVLAKKAHAHVNLIPLNYVKERRFKPSSPERLKAFKDILVGQDINVTIRRSLGSDVDAACGQLRRRHETGS
jgi:23S rRNA (adenine2503-C2)-methyltransferase